MIERIDIVTLFPQMFTALTEFGVVGRAISNGSPVVKTWNPRDFAEDKHRTVDDRPFGGGPGMVMQVRPVEKALQAARQDAPGEAYCVYMSPQGDRLNQDSVKALLQHPRLLLLAGRYEGLDERLIKAEVDREISIGDYVLSGGELPAMVLMDAVLRWLPGVLGDEDSAQQDSFADGLLDHPHYTRPEVLDGEPVPPVLLSGNHEEIRRWRLKQALGRTWLRRPDLIAKRRLSEEERSLLDAFIVEQED